MNFVLMLAAFLVILGVALAFQGILKTNIGEGIFLSAALVVLCLFLGGLAGFFSWGMYALFAISAAGYLLTIYGVVRQGKGKLSFLQSPCFILILLFFLYCLVAYYNDFIQHIDEFHQWAYAVKYMLETNLLPNHSALVGNQHPYATGLFYLFFQQITGYNEQNMYVASSLLVWIGLMLPFSEYERKDWKPAVLYCLIMYFGIYSLYSYGMKNLYVDLPVIAWAGGLAGWWMNRKMKKSNGLILLAGLVMICFFKWKAGPLMALFTLLFVGTHSLFVEKDILSDPKKRRAVLQISVAAVAVVLLCAILAGVYILYAPDPLGGLARIFGGTITREKATRTIGTFLTVVVGKPLTSKSDLKIAFVPFMIFVVMLQMVTAEMFQQKKKFRVYLCYTLVTTSMFLAVLLYTYLFIFSYEESIKMAGGIRYLSLYGVYSFMIVLVWLMQRREAVRKGPRGYIVAGILLLFLYGVNQEFVPNMTGLNSYKVNGFKQINKAKKKIKKFQTEITDKDRVYLLDQQGENEFAKNTAFYYMGEQVSNYNAEPWKFTENGSITRWAETEEPSIDDFPVLLAEGGYTYLWIHRTDEYLTTELPKVLKCEDEIADGMVYRVIYADGSAVGLENVW